MEHLTFSTLLNVTNIQGWVNGLGVKRQNNALRVNVNVDASPYFFARMNKLFLFIYSKSKVKISVLYSAK